MDRWVGRVALVTGASTGIGAAICEQLVGAGMVVVGVARNVEKINALSKKLEGQKGTLFGIKCDLTKVDDINNVFSVIKDKYKGVDVCINNAGMSHNNSLLDGTPEEWKEMLDINVVALCLCSKLAVKSMQERGVNDGHIIHVSSICGYGVFSDFPAAHFYSGTKFAVRALTEGLRQELRDLKTNIRISAISPGLVKTEFQERMMGKETTDQIFSNSPHLDSENVAASVCHMLSTPPHVQIHELIIKPVGESV